MASSNVSSANEKQEIKMDNNKPSSETEKVNLANSDIPSNAEKQEVKLANSDVPSSAEKQEVQIDNNRPTVDKEKIIGTATSEMEYRVELFNRLTHTCFNKCVEKRYKEGELHTGENSCIDRCVSKYWQVNNIIGHVLAYGRRTP